VHYALYPNNNSFKMKKLTFTLILAIMMLFVTAQTRYSRVKLFADQDDLLALAAKGLSIDHGVFKAGVYVICELSGKELAIADAAGIRYEMMIPDMTKYYAERNEPFLSRLDEIKRAKYILSRDWPVPEGFELGTCGGFLTIDQAMEHLDNMATLYPDLISPRYNMNYQTHNGQDLYWVRLSDNPTTNEDEPEVLYTGMHHAREPIGMQLLVYYMYYLLENYDTDPDVRYIVNNFELYFVPIVNMDGYAYNIQNDPNGGGMWRKNRRQNDDGSYGVDLNRNYGYMWGYNNSGSSPEPSDDTYRGPSAFSEPETGCLRDFCEAHDFRIAINYHSYDGSLLYPWGWSPVPCDHDAIFNAHAEILTTENGYNYGPGYTTIYATNGGSDDWMYGEQTTKDLIYSYTPEVGSGEDGFWPPVSNIIPLCQQNMYQNLMAARLAGPWAVARDLSPSIIENTTGLFFFDLQRLGLEDGANYILYIEPLSDAIASVGPPFAFSNLEILETVNGAFTYTLKENILNGEKVEYLLSVNNGLATFSDTIRKIYGTPVVIFEDSAASFSNWTSPKWNTTTLKFHSSPRSIADSPVGQYSNYENNAVILKDPIDLTDAVYARLDFWAQWDIEAGYDYVQVFVSSNDGGTWTPMEGKYTHPGNPNQTYGEPIYDGTQDSWVKEEINLEKFLGGQIKIRFVLKSDGGVVGDGFFWDDMTVTIVDLATGVETQDIPYPPVTNIKIQPNPAFGKVTMIYTLDRFYPGLNTLKVFDIMGHVVYETSLAHGADMISWDVSSWSSGIYFYSVYFDQAVVASGKLIVK
jgi:carboxypeptidase T